MSIDESGDWWTGSDASDLGPYLKALAKEEGTRPIDRFQLAQCTCGSQEFGILGDEDEGCVQRTCTSCKTSHFICDSGQYWAGAEPQVHACPECKSKTFNVGVGFSLRSRAVTDVRWITVGQRCVKCGVLGSLTDWKIDYTPSIQLIDQV